MGWSLLCDGLLGDGRDCSGYCHEGGHRHNCRCHVCGGLLWLVTGSVIALGLGCLGLFLFEQAFGRGGI